MRISRVVAAVATVVALTIGFAVPAEAVATTGSITVTVKYPNGTLASGGCLSVRHYGQTEWLKDCTASSGVLSLTGLAFGEYEYSVDGFEGYVGRYGGAFIDATTPAFKSTVTLKLGGLVTGAVKTSGGAAIQGATVKIFPTYETLTTVTVPVGVATTAADGTYSLRSSYAGWVRVVVTGAAGFGTSFGDTAYTSVGSSNVVNFSMYPAGSLTGTIAKPPGLDGSQFCVLAQLGAYPTYLAGKQCGAVGDPFAISLAPGGYEVCVTTTATALHCSEADSGTTMLVDGGQPQYVESGTGTALDLVWGGTLAVKVAPTNGDSLVGGCLTVTPVGALSQQDCAPTGGRFHFTFTSDMTGVSASYSLTGAVNGADTTWPTWIYLAHGGTVQHDLSVAAVGTGSLEVAITRADAVALTGGCVTLAYATSPGIERARDCSVTDGVASFTNLAPANYLVSVLNVSGTLVRLNYTNGGPSPSTSSPVAVSNDALTQVSLVVPTTLTISGAVSDSSGARSDGVVQFVVGSEVIAEATPAANGSYSLTVPILSGKLRSVGFAGMADMYYGTEYQPSDSASQGGASATSLALTGRDFSLLPTASLAGVIAAPDNFAAGDVCVFAQRSNATGSFGPGDCGAAGESFAIPVVPSRAYQLCVALESNTAPCGTTSATTSDFMGYGNGTSFSVPSTGGSMDVVLQFGGTIEATLNDDDGAFTGGCAILVERGVEVSRDCEPVEDVYTLVAGHDLAEQSGATRVRFEGVHGALDTADLWAPSVAGGDSTAMTFYPQAWPQIYGKITRPTGFGATHACVAATNFVDVWESVCLEPGQSAFYLPVPPGNYKVQFYTEEPGVAFEWFSDSATVEGAKWVDVHADLSRYLTATLVAAGALAGHVTAPDGTVAQGGCVNVYAADGAIAASDCVDEFGNYRVENLPAGKYRAKFYGFDGAAVRWYAAGTTYPGAKDITITAGATATANTSLVAPSSLTGTVSFDGEPATGGCVELWAPDGYFVTSTCDVVDGAYFIGDAPAGSYKVLFKGFEGAADEWSGEASTFDSATLVALMTGSSSVVSADLGQGGSISGGVEYDNGGSLLVIVELYDAAGNYAASQRAAVEIDGENVAHYTYSFANLPQGSYKVGIAVGTSGRFEWRKAAGEIAPDAIAVPSGESWDVVGKALPALDTMDGASAWGRLNVPSSFTSPVICAVAVNYAGTAVASDCGARGGTFGLTRLLNTSPYAIVFTNGSVRTAAQYKAFTGAKKFFGRSSTFATAPRYSFDAGEVAYFPVWFYSDINYTSTNFWQISWMGDQGVFQGYSDGSFKPANTLTRRDLATYLYRMAGSPSVTLPAKSPFSDVPAGSSGYAAIIWLYQKKAISGSTFAPSSGVTRKAEAVILYKLAGSPAVTLPTKSPFTDVTKSDPAFKAIYWASKYKIVPKATSTSFAPNTTTKRGGGAAHLYEWWWRFG